MSVSPMLNPLMAVSTNTVVSTQGLNSSLLVRFEEEESPETQCCAMSKKTSEAEQLNSLYDPILNFNH